MAGIPGFEPRLSESKSLVLPLHHIPTKFLAGAPGFEPRPTDSESVMLTVTLCPC
jgi:hypothetical protein